MRKPVVIDTNVLLVANGGPSYTRVCTLECAKQLLEIQKSGCVVLDHGYEILREYAKNQPNVGQPGIGLEFWKWLLNTKGSSDHCEFVTITQIHPSGYREFPSHDGLLNFDPSDRKFVAVSVVHDDRPPILQATDSKWLQWNSALKDCGVLVKYLCPEEIKVRYEKKIKRPK